MSKGGNFNRYWQDIVSAGRPGAPKPQKPQGDSEITPGRNKKPGGKPGRPGQTGRPGRPARPGKPGKPGSTQKPVQPLKSGKPPKPPKLPGASPKEQLDGQGLLYITLVQFLKRQSLVDSGGAGKGTVRAGGIMVNGAEELRPGRKLHQGDTVRVGGVNLTVTL